MYRSGEGVSQDYAEALKWYGLAAEQGNTSAMLHLGYMYQDGDGVPQDFVQAHMWFNLMGDELGKESRDELAVRMTLADISKAQRLAGQWRSRQQASISTTQPEQETSTDSGARPASRPLEMALTGSGFFVSAEGHILTNRHVVRGCSEVRIAGASKSKQVINDDQVDLALLKVTPAPSTVATFRSGRGIRTGDDIIVAGFPLQALLASGLNVTKGSVSSLADLKTTVVSYRLLLLCSQETAGGRCSMWRATSLESW
jgi:S1-C subfamily serine protease